MEKMSLVDYDGKIAATVFTGGCNFRCPFCHNSALVLEFKALPTLDEKEVFNYLEKRKGILEGVCITGGEPTLNPDLKEFAKKIKSLGYSVKLDTNGTNPQAVKNLFEEQIVDYFAVDIKNDKDNYTDIIGLKSFNTEKIEQTVAFLISSGAKYEFRTTLINEFHSTFNVKKIGEWIAGADKYFMQKFKSGDNCIKGGLSPVPIEKAKEFLETVKPYVKQAALRGYD